MRDVILVGGGGYIGSRLQLRLDAAEIPYENIDLGIFGKAGGRCVGALPMEHGAGAVVVWLASFHREPVGKEVDPQWAAAYHELMVEHPVRWSGPAFHLVYISSMRALTDRGSLYGRTKARAERRLVHHCDNFSVLRFGTVWGGWREGLPYRPSTALNYALTRGVFTGSHWSAFTTQMDLAVDFLAAHIEEIATETADTHVNTSAVTNVVDTTIPLVAEDVRGLLAGKFPIQHLQADFSRERRRTPMGIDLTEDVRAAEKLAAYYGLDRT